MVGLPPSSESESIADELLELLSLTVDNLPCSVEPIVHAIVMRRFFYRTQEELEENEKFLDIVECKITGPGSSNVFISLPACHANLANEIMEWLLSARWGNSPFFDSVTVQATTASNKHKTGDKSMSVRNIEISGKVFFFVADDLGMPVSFGYETEAQANEVSELIESSEGMAKIPEGVDVEAAIAAKGE